MRAKVRVRHAYTWAGKPRLYVDLEGVQQKGASSPADLLPISAHRCGELVADACVQLIQRDLVLIHYKIKGLATMRGQLIPGEEWRVMRAERMFARILKQCRNILDVPYAAVIKRQSVTVSRGRPEGCVRGGRRGGGLRRLGNEEFLPTQSELNAENTAHSSSH